MALPHIIMIAGRALLALLFILAGLSKIAGPGPVLAHMAEQRVPKFLLPFVIALEVAAGAALLAGWHIQIAAGVLALFCLATALVFHRDLAQRAERTQFAKDLALAGGLAFLAAAAM